MDQSGAKEHRSGEPSPASQLHRPETQRATGAAPLPRGQLHGRALGAAVASTRSATLDKYHKLFHIYYGQQFD